MHIGRYHAAHSTGTRRSHAATSASTSDAQTTQHHSAAGTPVPQIEDAMPPRMQQHKIRRAKVRPPVAAVARTSARAAASTVSVTAWVKTPVNVTSCDPVRGLLVTASNSATEWKFFEGLFDYTTTSARGLKRAELGQRALFSDTGGAAADRVAASAAW